jgi:hypothetical protein
VGGPRLPTGASIGQIWAAPGNEVFLWATKNFADGDVPESWVYHLKAGVWSEALYAPDELADWEGIFGTGPSDVYASAHKCPGGRGKCGPGEALTMRHFDGSTWSAMSLPVIQGMYGANIRGTPNDIYYAYHDPYWGNGGVLHYDGTSWSSSASGGGHSWGPLVYVNASEIYSINCFGYAAWNGSSWTYYAGFDFCDVYGVFGLRGGDGTLVMWAAGNNNWSNGIRAWQFVENPKGSMTGSWGSKYSTFINDCSGNGTAMGIWASGPNDFWVTGTCNSYTEGRIWRWDGVNWNRQLTSTALPSTGATWGTSPNDIWVSVAGGRFLHYGN